MESQKILVQPRLFRSWMAPAALGFCLLAVVLAIPGVYRLFDPAYRAYLLQDLAAGGIGSGSALQTYLLVEQVLLVAAPVLTGGMAVSLAVTLFAHPADGLGALSAVCQWLARGLNLAGILLVGWFAFRFLRYMLSCLMMEDGVYPLCAMIMSEALMGALAAFLFFATRRFLNGLCDSAASMAYTLTAGEVGAGGISGFIATGFFMLGGFCLAVAADQMFTLTIIYDLRPYYKLLVSPHWAQWATAASFGCAAVADVLLGCYLRRYQSISEKLLFQARQQMKL